MARMYSAPHEWERASAPAPTAELQAATPAGHAALYRRLLEREPDAATRAEALAWLQGRLDEVAALPGDLPESPDDLTAWMENNAQRVAAKYSMYLDERKAGAPRRYFSSRSHALYTLRAVAPTKLVDGSWLYGLATHWRNPRFNDLVRTYVEELGEGLPAKNHVLLYRQLLAAHALDPIDDLGDGFYEQGLIQLALGWNADALLPEVVGFNLGYEQLPLHLLITAYELNELGIDPYYFTLHVTVDNTDTGHARRACQAVMDTLPRLGDAGAYWERVRNGAKLGDLGLGTTAIIEDFDLEREVVRILARKSTAGHGAHSDYCRVAGRNVNDWLSDATQIPQFLAALEQAGWIRRGEPAEASRFWGLLQGERAEMFGVFSSYELQVIHDWIRGSASADGLAFVEQGAPTRPKRQPTFRAASRLAAARGQVAPATDPEAELLDPDLQALDAGLATLDAEGQMQLLVQALAPVQHWTPAGLKATRLFCERTRTAVSC